MRQGAGLASLGAAVVASLAFAACGGPKAALPAAVGVAALAPSTPLPSAAVAVPSRAPPPPAESHSLFPVPDSSIGPFLARHGDATLTAYIGTSSEGARRVVSAPLTSNGGLESEARVVAPISTDATMLVLRPTGGAKAGFVAAWTALTDRGESLSVLGLSDDGRPRGTPAELARTADDIVWVEVLPTATGALCLWAEQTHSGDANILAVALGPDGAMRGVPARIVRAVTGWQAVSTPDGAALALVAGTPAAAGPAGARRGAQITFLRIDADARPSGPLVTVASGVHLSGDLDAVRVEDQTLLAWTDRSRPDPQPVLATVDAAGHAHGPTRAIDGGAGGTLAGLAAGPAGAVMAWEEPFRRGRSSTRINLARVDLTSRTIDPRAEAPLDLQGRAAPEITGLDDGFALLAAARVCAQGERCDDAPVQPTFVRFDAHLAVTQVEPLRVGPLRTGVTAGWGLTCGHGPTCLALGVIPAAEKDPATILAIDLRARATVYRPPVVAPPPPGAPVVEALDTVAAGEPFADLASAPLGEGSVVALLTASTGESARRDDAGSISVRMYDEGGVAAGDGTVTRRALAAGGVAVATTDRPEDGAAIAWVARDGGDPQVHVTRVDRRGKVMHDAQLTNVKGDASDVAIAWSGDQWVVAWVDSRDGNGEVYATTLSRDGRGGARAQRITSAPGDASDVALLSLPEAQGPEGRGAIWLAWADPRESPQEGFADIYVAQLHPRDASRAGEELRVLATAAHSRSPTLAARNKDVAIGWIEEAPMGADAARAPAYGAMFAWLAPSGRVASEPTRLAVAGDGFPTAMTLDGTRRGLHVILARAAADMIVIDAAEMSRDGQGTPYPLVALDGPATLDVALGVGGDAIFFNDESADAEARRVRRAIVRWRR